MGKKKRSKKKQIPLTDETLSGFNNPFAALGASKITVTPEPDNKKASGEPPPPSTPQAQPDPLDFSSCKKIVLSRERKKRRGHTAVIVSGLKQDADGLKVIARALKKALGCGAIVEGDKVIVLGDIPDRVATWLESRGAARVVRGN